MKKILIITTAPFPFGSAAANLLRNLALGLKKNNKDVELILQRGNQFDNSKTFSNRVNYIDGIKFIYSSFYKRPVHIFFKVLDSLLGSIIPIFYILKYKISNKLDLIIIYNENSFEVLPAILLAKILNIRIVRYLVDWMPKESIYSRWWYLPKWWLYLFYLKVINFHFDGLIVISSFFKNYYVGKGFKESRVFTLPNLINTSQFKNISGSISKNIRIGYCGTPSERDGIKFLLEAFQILIRKYNALELLIIGDVLNNSVLPTLKKMAKDLNIEKSVIFAGRVSNKEVPRLLHSCNILVLPRPQNRLSEAGFPTKLGEYFACNKPVIVTKVGDIGRYLKDRKEVLFTEPSNSVDLSKKIEILINDKNLSSHIAHNANKWAEENLDYIIQTEKLLAFFKTL